MSFKFLMGGTSSIAIDGKDYKLQHEIGIGATASVTQVEGPGGEQLALKRILLRASDSDASAKITRAKRELELHKMLSDANTPHLLPLTASSIRSIDPEDGGSDDDEEAENVYLDIEVVLVTPLAKCGTLDSYLEDMELEWTEDDVVSIFQQVVTAVDALHSRTPSIVHRDIKAGNVFVDNDRPGGWVVMLGDLGSAQALDESGQVPVPDEETAKAVQADINANTTSTFRAPEQFHVTTDSQPLTTAVDMWGLGVLLYSMMFQIAPFESMKDLMAGKYELSSDAASLWSAPLLDVLHGTLQPDPAARWTTSTLLTHLDKYWPSHGKELVRAEYKRQRPATPPRDPSAPARPSRAAMRSKGRISSTRSIPRRPMGPVDPAELEAAKATGSSSKPRSRSSSKTGGSAKPKAPRPPSFDGSGIKFFDDDGKIGV